jgi:hypothetical protein
LRVGRTWQQEDAAHFEFKRRDPAAFMLIFDGNAEIGKAVDFSQSGGNNLLF